MTTINTPLDQENVRYVEQLYKGADADLKVVNALPRVFVNDPNKGFLARRTYPITNPYIASRRAPSHATNGVGQLEYVQESPAEIDVSLKSYKRESIVEEMGVSDSTDNTPVRLNEARQLGPMLMDEVERLKISLIADHVFSSTNYGDAVPVTGDSGISLTDLSSEVNVFKAMFLALNTKGIYDARSALRASLELFITRKAAMFFARYSELLPAQLANIGLHNGEAPRTNGALTTPEGVASAIAAALDLDRVHVLDSVANTAGRSATPSLSYLGQGFACVVPVDRRASSYDLTGDSPVVKPLYGPMVVTLPGRGSRAKIKTWFNEKRDREFIQASDWFNVENPALTAGTAWLGNAKGCLFNGLGV